MNDRGMKGAWLAMGLALAAPAARSSEGLETPPSFESVIPTPPEEDRTPALLKPFKRVGRAATWGLARASQPFMNYSRYQLVKLLPSRKHLPPHLAHRDHWDYPGPLQWVPRGWTTYGWGKPAMVLGNQDHERDGAPMPIGEQGSFQISVYPDLPAPFCWLPVYFAFTLPNGVHFRLGARWDDVDSYVNLPSVAIKKRVKIDLTAAAPPKKRPGRQKRLRAEKRDPDQRAY